MFMLFNYVQIKCDECKTTSHFAPGKKYNIIECPVCKAELENKEKVKTQRKSKKGVTSDDKE